MHANTSVVAVDLAVDGVCCPLDASKEDILWCLIASLAYAYMPETSLDNCGFFFVIYYYILMRPTRYVLSLSFELVLAGSARPDNSLMRISDEM